MSFSMCLMLLRGAVLSWRRVAPCVAFELRVGVLMSAVAASVSLSVWPIQVCPPSALDHTHCRSFLRNLRLSHCDNTDGMVTLDVMARCYSVKQLREFLDPRNELRSHRRCRGGLLSFLRFVAQLARMGVTTPSSARQVSSKDVGG